MNVAKLFTNVALATSVADDILTVVQYLVTLAEGAGGTGADKLAAVKSGLESFLKTKYPTLVSSFDTIWTEAEAIINGMVSIFNALGVFKKAAATTTAVSSS